jgi:hypothetical protein
LPEKCGSLEVSQPYGPSLPVSGIVLLFTYVSTFTVRRIAMKPRFRLEDVEDDLRELKNEDLLYGVTMLVTFVSAGLILRIFQSLFVEFL